MFYHKIPDDQDIVTIEVKNASEAVGCVFVSIQNNTVRTAVLMHTYYHIACVQFPIDVHFNNNCDLTL